MSTLSSLPVAREVSSRTLLPPALAQAGLHEFYAGSEADGAATSGVILALASQSAGPILWVRQAFLNGEAGTPYPQGLMEFGIDPARIILIQPKDAPSVLQAGLEGARAPALAAVLMELWGEVKALDLTASRRLALAARATGTRLLMGRVAAQPCPSAAETRWDVRVAQSRALAANAPGPATVALRLLRHRGGREADVWQWEWNRDRTCFDPRHMPEGSARATPLSGTVVPVSFHGQVSADDAGAAPRQAG